MLAVSSAAGRQHVLSGPGMPDSVTLAAAAAAACGAVAAAACVRAGGGAELAAANAELAALRATLAAEQAEREKAEKNRQAEWAGRRKAEKQLLSDVKHGNAANLDYPLVPIGTAASCFRDCSGTPRQPGLATSTRVRLSFVKQLPPGALDGLDKHSHVWVIYVFHRNTNIGKALEVHGKHGAQFVGKVRPPRLGGKAKLGVLATRCASRPRPACALLVLMLPVRCCLGVCPRLPGACAAWVHAACAPVRCCLGFAAAAAAAATAAQGGEITRLYRLGAAAKQPG